MPAFCDYCDEGNVAEKGWHYFVDPEDDGTSYRVPCAIHPPKEEPVDPEEELVTETIVAAARKYKAGYVEEQASLIGTHDPVLDARRGARMQLEALIQMFEVLTDSDGELPHELPVLANLRQELENIPT